MVNKKARQEVSKFFEMSDVFAVPDIPALTRHPQQQPAKMRSFKDSIMEKLGYNLSGVALSNFYYYADQRCLRDPVTNEPYKDGIYDRKGDYAVECGPKLKGKRLQPVHKSGRYLAKMMGRYDVWCIPSYVDSNNLYEN